MSARLSLHARQSCFYGLQEQNGVLCARHILLYACIGISQQPRSQGPLLLGPRSERERPRRRGPWERERSIKAQKADAILMQCNIITANLIPYSWREQCNQAIPVHLINGF